MPSAEQQRVQEHSPAPPPPGFAKAAVIGKGFLAGCIASCGAVAVTNPIDVVRTRLELQGELAKGGTQLYRGALHGLGKMWQQEGPGALFRGIQPAFAYQIAVNGTRLGTFLPLKKWLVAHREQHGLDDFGASLLAGAVAGMVGAAIGTPFQLVKTRMQAAARGAAVGAGAGPGGGAAAATAAAAGAAVVRQPYSGLRHALSSIVRAEGVSGLYRGARLNMLKIAVASAIQLAVFDGVKARLQHLGQQRRQGQGEKDGQGGWGQAHPAAVLLLSAMAAGLAVTAVVHPVDVITTRLWNQPVVDGVGLLYRDAWQCAAKTVAAEGPQALYKGCTAHFMRVGPHTVLTLLLLDRAQRALGLHPPQQQQDQPAAKAARPAK